MSTPPTITLDAFAIEAVREYRKTKAAYAEACDKANGNTTDGLWSIEDMQAVENTLKAHQRCELHTAVMFDRLASEAGVK